MCAAAAAQEEAEDLSAAQEVVAKDMAVGTLVITHLTQQDLRAKEILLPKQAVEANILPALTYPLLKFKVLPTAFANCICPLAFRLSLSLQLFLVGAAFPGRGVSILHTFICFYRARNL